MSVVTWAIKIDPGDSFLNTVLIRDAQAEAQTGLDKVEFSAEVATGAVAQR